MSEKTLSEEQKQELLQQLKNRFKNIESNFPKVKWATLEAKLLASEEKLWSLYQMEASNGEPNLFDYDANKDEYHFCDFAKESPKARRSLCYDQAALEARKKFKPEDSAENMAKSMGVAIMTESQYKKLQKLGEFDTKTSSWLKTPDEVRELGGAIFGDYRFGRVFIYHNGAESYYKSRGFRAFLSV